jgi:BirA family biotin operon repressor/biotin-[acetyl-CoA-carboxylase] ligase
VRRVAQTGSTNADLAALATSGRGVDGAVLVADHQTAGRGRQGRVWQDRPAGSLLVSVLLRADPAGLGLVPLAAGLAAVSALAERAGVDAGLKWPNDVLVPSAGERKLAGILAEVVASGDRPWVVLGMGCNLTWPDERPGELADRLVALDEVAGGDRPSRDELLDAWLLHLDRRLDQLATATGRGALVADYRRVCLSLGRQIRLDTPAGSVQGRVTGVADDGGLLVDVGGAVRRFDAGDVHHI